MLKMDPQNFFLLRFVNRTLLLQKITPAKFEIELF